MQSWLVENGLTKISLLKSLKRKVVEKPSFNDEWTDNETMLWQNNNNNTTSIIIENEEHEHNDCVIHVHIK